VIKRAILGGDDLAIRCIEPDADRLIGGETFGKEQKACSGRAGLRLNCDGRRGADSGNQQQRRY